MEKEGTTWPHALIILAGISVSNFVHSATFFYLLKYLGAVSVAVMKGLQSVFVFVMADVIYCKSHKNQCFDAYKVISLIVVVGGVLAYAVVTSRLSDASREVPS